MRIALIISCITKGDMTYGIMHCALVTKPDQLIIFYDVTHTEVYRALLGFNLHQNFYTLIWSEEVVISICRHICPSI